VCIQTHINSVYAELQNTNRQNQTTSKVLSLINLNRPSPRVLTSPDLPYHVHVTVKDTLEIVISTAITYNKSIKIVSSV